LRNRENEAKNVPKGPKEKSTKPVHRMYVDLTSSKYTSTGGSKYWCLAVDEATHMKFSMFLKQKSEMKEKLVPFLKERRAHHIIYSLVVTHFMRNIYKYLENWQ